MPLDVKRRRVQSLFPAGGGAEKCAPKSPPTDKEPMGSFPFQALQRGLKSPMAASGEETLEGHQGHPLLSLPEAAQQYKRERRWGRPTLSASPPRGPLPAPEGPQQGLSLVVAWGSLWPPLCGSAAIWDPRMAPSLPCAGPAGWPPGAPEEGGAEGAALEAGRGGEPAAVPGEKQKVGLALESLQELLWEKQPVWLDWLAEQEEKMEAEWGGPGPALQLGLLPAAADGPDGEEDIQDTVDR
ncbi:hypothetical protein E2320_023060 [Naja naja]|nr:hypothetical protein E2320_023060 [Naja naja]